MISLRFDPETGACDTSWSDGHLDTGNDLETAALISLHSDALNPDREIGEAPGGSPLDELWPDDPWGSRLWTLARRKATGPEGAKALRDAETYAVEALQWMVADGIAREVVAEAEWLPPSPFAYALALVVYVYRPDTKDPVKLGPWEFLDAV